MNGVGWTQIKASGWGAQGVEPELCGPVRPLRERDATCKTTTKKSGSLLRMNVLIGFSKNLLSTALEIETITSR